MSILAHRFGQAVSWSFLRAFSALHVSGAQRLPRGGPLLLLANHISHYDPPALSASSRLVINYMTDRAMLEVPYFGRVLRGLETFPVDRDQVDRAAVKTALTRLKAGRVVGVFPEGGIRDGAQSVLGGAAMPPGGPALWAMARCPAVVACIIGTDQLYVGRNFRRRPRIFVRYGEVLPPPERGADRAELGVRLAAELRTLYREIDERYQLTEDERPASAQARWASA
ncbi:MAG: lysophospholipid acyltransferase family protein [Verrucomicrobiota bacterium]